MGTIYSALNVTKGHKPFTDMGSNDLGSNNTRSNDIGSNIIGSNNKWSKTRQRVKMEQNILYIISGLG